MKSRVLAMMALTSIAMPSLTNATESNTWFYFGIDHHSGTHTANIPSPTTLSADTSDLKLNGIKFKMGLYLAEDIAIEASVLTGTGGDSKSVVDTFIGPTTQTTEIDHILSLFFKGDLPLSDKAKLYGLIGFSSGKFTTQQPATYPASLVHSDSGVSYGVGASYQATEKVFINAEYVMYWSELDDEHTAINLGLTRRF
jgi:opacity protein-like surface antigen